MDFVSAFLTISYLFRSFRHISLRTNLYVGIILLSFFLTSSYQITYLEFLTSLNNLQYNFDGFNSILSNWFSGDQIPLLLSVFLYIIAKCSLHKLSLNLIFELISLIIGVSIALLKIFSLKIASPIIISLIICNIFHFFRNKKSINLAIIQKKEFFKNLFFLSFSEKLKLLFPALFLGLVIFSNLESENLNLLSSTHTVRILFAIVILILSFLSNYLSLKKIIRTYLPVFTIYLGLIISSFFAAQVNDFSINTSLGFNSMTSIAFFPIVELFIRKYYLLSPDQQFSFIRVPTFMFRVGIKLITLFIIITYLLFLFTQ